MAGLRIADDRVRSRWALIGSRINPLIIMTTQGHIIIGTAGHIDHGKTSLVKSLTGMDTDRLKEEKERGITIELGFATFVLPSGLRLGLVDVPGHERFVKNMVAGATGIDLVLLVIAADEGIMPQTREHLDICQLLGVRDGIVVLTKTDLVEEEWIEMVTEEVREYLSGTFLEDSPIITFSAVSGEGRDVVAAAIEAAAVRIPERMDDGIFRLPVDRVFSMKGFGTVVTGTLISGKISSGEEIHFFPGDRGAKLRGIQVHDEMVPVSRAGTRTALNLQGVDKNQIRRGQTASKKGELVSTHMLDAQVRMLSSVPRPLKNRDRVRLHLYTAEIMTRAVILHGEVILPGEEALVQFRLEEPTVALPGDRFVLRSYSPVATIGGGVIIDPLPMKHKRNRTRVKNHLKQLQEGGHRQIVLTFLEEAGEYGLEVSILSIRTGLAAATLMDLLREMAGDDEVVVAETGDGILVYSSASFDKIKERVVKGLEKFHRANPDRPGMGREELRMRVARQLSDRPYRNLLAVLQERGAITLEGEIVRVRSHQATLSPEQESLAKEVLKMIGENGLEVPFLGEMTEHLGSDVKELKPVLNLLAKRNDLVRIKDDYFISFETHRELIKEVEKYFETNPEMTMPEFRRITNTTRKWMIPILEYLDRTQITMRKGDVRIKRGTVNRRQ